MPQTRVDLVSLGGDNVDGFTRETNELAETRRPVEATRTDSLKSEASVVFTLHGSLEHVAATLGLGGHLGENNKWRGNKRLEEQCALLSA